MLRLSDLFACQSNNSKTPCSMPLKFSMVLADVFRQMPSNLVLTVQR